MTPTSTEKLIKSPCISVCALDDNDICTGCFRSVDEIRGWNMYSNQEREAVLALAFDREKQVNPFL